MAAILWLGSKQPWIWALVPFAVLLQHAPWLEKLIEGRLSVVLWGLIVAGVAGFCLAAKHLAALREQSPAYQRALPAMNVWAGRRAGRWTNANDGWSLRDGDALVKDLLGRDSWNLWTRLRLRQMGTQISMVWWLQGAWWVCVRRNDALAW